MDDAQFFSALTALGSKIDGRFDQLDAKLSAHAAEDKLVADRVLIIETQRTEEKGTAAKRGTYAGIVAGGSISGLLKLLDHFWK